jgi:O-antigen/teichoic acid export membrane protein
MLFASLPITIISVLFPREIILFLSNPDFISGSAALVILGFTLPFIYLDTLLGEILVANDERKLLIRIAIFILLFNFTTNLILIPIYSFKAAAFTTVLSEVALFVINYHYTQKIVRYQIESSSIKKIILVSIISLISGFLLKKTGWNFLILIAIIFALYGILTSLFRVYSINSLIELFKPRAILEDND